MPGKITVYAGRKDPAAGLPLEIFVAADMVSIGMGVVNCGQIPMAGLQNLADFPSCVFVAAAVN